MVDGKYVATKNILGFRTSVMLNPIIGHLILPLKLVNIVDFFILTLYFIIWVFKTSFVEVSFNVMSSSSKNITNWQTWVSKGKSSKFISHLNVTWALYLCWIMLFVGSIKRAGIGFVIIGLLYAWVNWSSGVHTSLVDNRIDFYDNKEILLKTYHFLFKWTKIEKLPRTLEFWHF